MYEKNHNKDEIIAISFKSKIIPSWISASDLRGFKIEIASPITIEMKGAVTPARTENIKPV